MPTRISHEQVSGVILKNGLPPGLTLGPGGVISGKPTEQGNWVFKVIFTDDGTGKVEKTYILTVLD